MTFLRSHIQIRNMLTRLSGRSNCWSGGPRVWGREELIGGDYKPQWWLGARFLSDKVLSQLTHRIHVSVHHLQAAKHKTDMLLLV